MAHLTPYLSFTGNCREAMTCYQSCLGGALSLQCFADSPIADQVPAGNQEHILHGRLFADQLVLFGSDAEGLRVPLTPGNSVALCLSCSSEAEITTLFAQLSAGGNVLDPLQVLFWGGTFGALVDQFGVKWLFSYDRSAAE